MSAQSSSGSAITAVFAVLDEPGVVLGADDLTHEEKLDENAESLRGFP